jgi:L-aminopeptidase/D-esterase-like protein
VNDAERYAHAVSITDVAGIRVGHWSDHTGKTGCTVVLAPPEGAVASCDVRGSAPGTRETDLLRPGRTVERVHAICLAGGSAFGLAAADGVMRYLLERGIGQEVRGLRVPIVPAAVIFDLGVGSPDVHPGPEEGYAACVDAERGGAGVEGAVGAGVGATVGKLLDSSRASPGGVGTASIRLPDGVRVGALAVVNACGDVVDEGRVVAGREELGGTWRALLESGAGAEPRLDATTLGVVATDARLDRAQCQKLAEVAHDGLALAIRPVHTIADGDTVFALSAGERAGDPLRLGVAATEAMRRAIVRAVDHG